MTIKIDYLLLGCYLLLLPEFHPNRTGVVSIHCFLPLSSRDAPLAYNILFHLKSWAFLSFVGIYMEYSLSRNELSAAGR